MERAKKRFYFTVIAMFAVLIGCAFIPHPWRACAVAGFAVFSSVFCFFFWGKGHKHTLKYGRAIRSTLLYLSVVFLVFYTLSAFLGWKENAHAITPSYALSFLVPMLFTVLATERLRSTITAQGFRGEEAFAFILIALFELLLLPPLSRPLKTAEVIAFAILEVLPVFAVEFSAIFIVSRYGVLPVFICRSAILAVFSAFPRTPALSLHYLALSKLLIPLGLLAVLIVSAVWKERKMRATQEGKASAAKQNGEPPQVLQQEPNPQKSQENDRAK